MKKIKVQFPDGSIADIDESDLQSALSGGAKVYTEPASQNIVKFADGSTADLNDADSKSAIAGGATLVKKKGLTSLPDISGNGNSNSNSLFGNQFNDLGLPQLSQENGSPLTIDPKTIPVTPFANQSEYVIGLQERLKTNKLTPQDSQVIYKNTNPISTFNSNDDAELQRLSELNKLSIESISALKIPASISALIPEFENKSIGEVIDSPEAKYTQALQLKDNLNREVLMKQD